LKGKRGKTNTIAGIKGGSMGKAYQCLWEVRNRGVPLATR